MVENKLKKSSKKWKERNKIKKIEKHEKGKKNTTKENICLGFFIAATPSIFIPFFLIVSLSLSHLILYPSSKPFGSATSYEVVTPNNEEESLGFENNEDFDFSNFST